MDPVTPDEIPERVLVGANGAYWRDWNDGTLSMAIVSDDNDPVDVVAVYARVDGTFAKAIAQEAVTRALRDVRSRIPKDQVAALAAIGEAISIIEKED